jgi:ABC-2 type transport system permease protein
MGLVGLISGIWADKFDQMAAITNFLVTPLSLLSGTFYSISNLPGTFYLISQFNPFFYMIDGFRYSLIGYSDASILTGSLVLFFLNLILFIIVIIMLKTGYRLKS